MYCIFLVLIFYTFSFYCLLRFKTNKQKQKKQKNIYIFYKKKWGGVSVLSSFQLSKLQAPGRPNKRPGKWSCDLRADWRVNKNCIRCAIRQTNRQTWQLYDWIDPATQFREIMKSCFMHIKCRLTTAIFKECGGFPGVLPNLYYKLYPSTPPPLSSQKPISEALCWSGQKNQARNLDGRPQNWVPANSSKNSHNQISIVFNKEWSCSSAKLPK